MKQNVLIEILIHVEKHLKLKKNNYKTGISIYSNKYIQ